jgi:hypothetical protein
MEGSVASLEEIIGGKLSIIGGVLTLPSADWNDNAECNSGSQAFVNRLV